MKTVKELRQAGFTVKVRHNRVPDFSVKMDSFDTPTALKPKGGFTEVNIYHELGHLLGTGYASCCALDNYNRRIGKNIAFGRALKDATTSGKLTIEEVNV